MRALVFGVILPRGLRGVAPFPISKSQTCIIGHFVILEGSLPRAPGFGFGGSDEGPGKIQVRRNEELRTYTSASPTYVPSPNRSPDLAL